MVGNGVDLASGAFAGNGLMEPKESSEYGYGLEAGIAVGVGSGEVTGDFVAGEQVENRDFEAGQDDVGEFGGEGAGAFQDIVDVGLRNSGEPGEAAFGQFTVPNAAAELFEEPVLESSERLGGDFHEK